MMIIGILVGFSTLHAQDFEDFGMEVETVAPTGLVEGDTAPNFTAMGLDGDAVSLDSLTADGAVVLIFYRGAWCPYCMKYLSNVNDSISKIEAMGGKVVAITPQSAAQLIKAAKKTGEGALILSDVDGSIIDAYDVAFDVTNKYERKVKMGGGTNIAKSNGQEQARLPVPATYVVDATGMIIYRHFDYNYKNRATVKDILKALAHQSF